MMRSLFPIVTNNDLVFPDNFVNHFFGDFMKPFDSSYSVPKVDVEDKGTEYVLTTDLPGMAKEDIKLTYDKDILTISARHEEKKDETDKKKNYIRKERTSQSFCRQFQVSGIQKDHIQAAFANGVLTVTLPKETAQQIEAAKTIEIQ